MSRNLVLKAIYSEFPSYKVINITEVGFPVFKKTIKCLATLSKGLPVVLEYTLKLTKLGYSIEQIAEMLGLEESLISAAFYDLIQLGLIDLKTHKVTDDGRRFLITNSYSSLEIVDLNINVDSYTGEITKNYNYIRSRDTKTLNLHTVKPLLSKNSDEYINNAKIKTIFKKLKKEEDPEFEGSLVEIAKLNNRPNEYRRLFLIVLETQDNQNRIVVYDKDTRLEYMEQKIIQADSQGVQFLKLDDNGILASQPSLTSNYETIEQDYYDIMNLEILESDYNLIEYTIPLVDILTLSDGWISSLKNLLKSKTQVKINFCGPRYPNDYQRNQISKIIYLKQNHQNLSVTHNSEFKFPTIIINNMFGYTNQFYEYKLDLASNRSCLAQTSYQIKNVTLDSEGNERSLEYPLLNKTTIKLKQRELVSYIKDLDYLMNEYYGVGWLKNGRLLNEYLIENLVVATDLSKFTSFTAQFYGCVGEVIKSVGDAEGIQGYFFKEFKERVPKVQRVVDKLRVYRNSVQHSHLDERQVKLYIEYLNEDLKGSFPEFKKDGYLILQTIIINDLIKEVKFGIQELKAIQVK